MTRTWHTGFGLVGLALLLVACTDQVATTQGGGGAVYNQGVVVKSALAPKAVADAFRARGFERVSLVNGGKAVRVTSSTTGMIDCGTLSQVARGNRVQFKGNAPLAAVLDDDRPDDVLWRKMKSRSVMTLTQSDAGGYVLVERHNIELNKRWASRPASRTKRAIVGATGSGKLDDDTTCRSAGIAQRIL